MALNGPLQAWEIESQVKTASASLGICGLVWPAGELSGWSKKTGSVGKPLGKPRPSLLLDEPTNHLILRPQSGWPLLKNSKKTVLFITHDRYFLDALSTRIFELTEQMNWISETSGLCSPQGWTRWAWRCPFSTRKNNSANKNWPDAQTTAGTCDQQQALYHCFTISWKRSLWCCWNRLDSWTLKPAGFKKSSSFRMFLCLWKQAPFCKVLTLRASQRPYRNR